MTPEQMRRAADLLDADAAELRLDGMGDDGRWHIHDERHHYDELTTLARLLREQADAMEREPVDIIGRMCHCTTEPQKRLCHKRGLCMSAVAYDTGAK